MRGQTFFERMASVSRPYGAPSPRKAIAETVASVQATVIRYLETPHGSLGTNTEYGLESIEKIYYRLVDPVSRDPMCMSLRQRILQCDIRIRNVQASYERQTIGKAGESAFFLVFTITLREIENLKQNIGDVRFRIALDMVGSVHVVK